MMFPPAAAKANATSSYPDVPRDSGQWWIAAGDAGIYRAVRIATFICEKLLLRMRLTWILLITAFAVFFSYTGAVKRKMIVFAIGGYRYNYANNPSLKSVRWFYDEGVVAPYVYPVYPSLSYTNLYSLVTGLYPEHHGIIGDIMYDQKTGEFYEPLTERDASKSGRWLKADPIWTTAEKQGVETAIYWWPGCEILTSGIHPIICEIHRHGMNHTSFKIDLLERIDDAIAMFKNDELNLALIYYDLVEKSGLLYGPDSKEAEHALQTADDILLQLMEAIHQAQLQDEVNILIVSDSGLESVNPGMIDYINMNRFKENILYQVMFGPLSMLLPVPGKEEKLFSELKHANIKGLKTFRKSEIPLEYHFGRSDKTLPIFLQAQHGHFIAPLIKENSLKQDERVKGPHYTKYKGINGYDPEEDKDMLTVFFAKGPAFKKGFVTESLSNVDIYNVICSVLKMECLPNNGSTKIIEPMFIGNEYIEVIKSGSSTLYTNCYYVTVLLIAYILKL